METFSRNPDPRLTPPSPRTAGVSKVDRCLQSGHLSTLVDRCGKFAPGVHSSRQGWKICASQPPKVLPPLASTIPPDLFSDLFSDLSSKEREKPALFTVGAEPNGKVLFKTGWVRTAFKKNSGQPSPDRQRQRFRRRRAAQPQAAQPSQDSLRTNFQNLEPLVDRAF